MTSYIKRSLLRPINSEDVPAVHHGDPQKQSCLFKELDAALDVGPVLQRLFCLLVSQQQTSV